MCRFLVGLVIVRSCSFYSTYGPLAKPVYMNFADVGDWERLAVRTVNGEATQVDYHAHSNTGSTVLFSQAPKFDNNSRPVAYVAKGSHGIWETAATHTYVDAVIFKLQDLTSDGGVYW